jgi:hypothetical protein
MSLPFRLLVAASRVLRFFPALVLAFVIVSAGLAVREFILQAADQFVAVESSVGAGK